MEEVVATAMYGQIVISFIFSCVMGGFVAAMLTMIIRAFVIHERAQKLKDEDNTDEAAATVLGKEHYTTRNSRKNGSTTSHHYKVSYEFSAEKADGTPCKVQVFGREIDGTAWDRLVEGKTVQVLYLAGRPGSCRMKDMVETESDYAGTACKVGVIVIFLFLLASVLGTMFSTQAAILADRPESQQIKIGSLLGFLLSCCGCGVLCGGHSYQSRTNDNIYGGQVVVEELPESDYDNLLDNE